MGLLRFIRRLNCFGNGQRREKSTKQVERELYRMQATIRAMEEKIETTKWIIEECKKQQLAEEREQMARDTRGQLMDQVGRIEIELGQALKHRQVTITEITKSGLRKMALEKNLQAMEKKATFFCMELYHSDPDPRTTVKIWRENLRQMRSQNDMHKAMPQPPLCPVQAFDEEELIWETQKLSCDDVINAKCLQNVSQMATNL